MTNAYQKAKSFMFTVATPVTLALATAPTARADDSALQGQVTTALTTGATAVGAILAVAITIVIAMKGYSIIKRAFSKG